MMLILGTHVRGTTSHTNRRECSCSFGREALRVKIQDWKSFVHYIFTQSEIVVKFSSTVQQCGID